jgi:hypothetical protein
MASPSLDIGCSPSGYGHQVLLRRKRREYGALLGISLIAGMIFSQVPGLGYGVLGMMAIALRYPHLISALSISPLYRRINWKTTGVLLGVLLFILINTHADPAAAQLFKTAEDQANTIFGNYIDKGILTFLFGMLRIVIWVSGVGFVMLAVYQAQRGEQWQPLIQNAFIIVAAIVVVEGLSSMFFGKK